MPIPVAQRVDELDFADEIDEMLQEGTPASDVARFIRDTLNLLTDVKESTLVEVLRSRRQQLGVVIEEMDPTWPAANVPKIASKTRTPNALVRTMYGRVIKGMDELLELQAAIIAQRDRISWMMELEHDHEMPFDKVGEEIDRLRRLVKDHAELRLKLGAREDGPDLSVSLDVRGIKSRLGKELAAVLDEPESRHKIIALIGKLRNLRALPAGMIDGEAVEVPVRGT